MTILLTTPRQMLMLFGVWSGDSITMTKKVLCECFCAMHFVIDIMGILASAALFLKFVSLDLKFSLYGMFTVFGFTISTYNVAFLYCSRNKIASFVEDLNHIYETSVVNGSSCHLITANAKSELIWKKYFIYGIGGFCVGMVISSVLSVILVYYIHGKFMKEMVYVPYKYILPWDQTTPLGYFSEMMFIILAGEGYFLSNGVTLLFFITICLQNQAFYQVFQHSLNAIQLNDTMKRKQILLNGLVNLHISMKSWFVSGAEIYSIFVLVALICNNLSLACLAFHLQQELKHIGFDVCVLLFAGSVGVAILYIYCYFGKLASESYEKICECLFNYDWYELPIDLEKHFILMIGNASQPLYYHGFGIVTLNLQTFCQFLRALYTCIMLLSTITEA